jgi:hypothetical protein
MRYNFFEKVWKKYDKNKDKAAGKYWMAKYYQVCDELDDINEALGISAHSKEETGENALDAISDLKKKQK